MASFCSFYSCVFVEELLATLGLRCVMRFSERPRWSQLFCNRWLSGNALCHKVRIFRIFPTILRKTRSGVRLRHQRITGEPCTLSFFVSFSIRTSLLPPPGLIYQTFPATRVSSFTLGIRGAASDYHRDGVSPSLSGRHCSTLSHSVIMIMARCE